MFSSKMINITRFSVKNFTKLYFKNIPAVNFSRSAINLCEFENAKAAAERRKVGGDEKTIFDKIISREIPASIIYEDEKCLAFNDVSPQAPVHFLVIPKQRIPKLDESSPTDAEILGHVLYIAGKLGKEKAPEGFRTVINNGINSLQSVYHLHLHVIGGRRLKWPPG